MFQVFNVSKYRVGQLTGDEATMLFRSVAANAAKLQLSLGLSSTAVDTAASSSTGHPQSVLMQLCEELTKTAFGDHETLSVDAFCRVCDSHAAIQRLLQAFESERNTVE